MRVIVWLVKSLVSSIVKEANYYERDTKLPFVYLVDHCFSIKGKGTVVTGTVIQGKVSKGDNLEIPEAGFLGKIKSIQMFRKNMKEARQGDRVGMLLPGLDPTGIERTLACEQGTVRPCDIVIGTFDKIKYWKDEITSKTKYHLSIGNKTTMATLYLAELDTEQEKLKDDLLNLNLNNELLDHEHFLSGNFKFIESVSKKFKKKNLLCILILQKPVYMTLNSFYIGSRLELGEESKSCRMSFSGRCLQLVRLEGMVDSDSVIDEAQLGLKLHKQKFKFGVIERFNSANIAIMKDMFGKGVDVTQFVGREILFENEKIRGVVQGAFGKKGKIKVQMSRTMTDDEQKELVGAECRLVIMRYVKIKK